MANPVPILDSLPVGFRFRPTDEELVDHYLKHKLLGDYSLVMIIPEIDICKHEPWDLPAFSVIKSDDPEWFFLSPCEFKYSNSSRLNRATKAGFWKTTGKDRKVKTRGTNNVIGTKKTLVFYKGRVPHGVKTNWVIHEYHAVTFSAEERTFVLCRLMKKPEKKAEEVTNALEYGEGEPSSHDASEYENQATADRIPDVNRNAGEGKPSSHDASEYENQATADRIPDVCPLPEVNLESIFRAPRQADENNLSSIHQSPILCEQNPSVQNSPVPNAFFQNDNSSTQFPFETSKEEDNADEFLNSILADDVCFSNEGRHAFVGDSTPSGSLRRVYCEGSDTHAEVVSARHDNILDTTAVCNAHVGSRENRVMKMVKSSHGAVHDATSLSSNHEGNREKEGGIFKMTSGEWAFALVTQLLSNLQRSTVLKLLISFHSKRMQNSISAKIRQLCVTESCC